MLRFEYNVATIFAMVESDQKMYFLHVVTRGFLKHLTKF